MCTGFARRLVLAWSLATATLAFITSASAQGPFERYDLLLPGGVTLAPDLGKLAGPVAELRLSPEPQFVDITLTDNDRLAVSTFAVGTDSVSVQYCDATGRCDEVSYVFAVTLENEITSSTVFDTVTVGGSVITYCIDTSELPGMVNSVSDACADGDKPFVSFVLLPATGCIKYSGISSGGTDSSCVVICDDLGFCDTTTVFVTTVEPNEYPDQELEFEIFVGDRRTTAIDVSTFVNPIASVANTCPDLSGTAVDYDLNSAGRELTFTGIAVGTERACIDVEDDAGRMQRTNVSVRVLPRETLTDTLRIRSGQTLQYCFARYRLDTDAVSVVDECDMGAVIAGIDYLSGQCITVTGNEEGIRDACLAFCDNTGACDRLDLYVEVLPADDNRMPVANDDAFTVTSGTTGTFDVTANDVNVGVISALEIIEPPMRGTSSISSERQLLYLVDLGSCTADTLSYQVCNEFGCDQAVVIINTDCSATGDRPAIATQTGFSPNADGTNETFVIKNLEFYPGNTVKVYNRWGSRVLEATNYGNDWDGSFDGSALPDGTYFYVVSAPELAPVAGYVQLSR